MSGGGGGIFYGSDRSGEDFVKGGFSICFLVVNVVVVVIIVNDRL